MNAAEKNITVLIVEDHAIASAGLKFLLDQQNRFDVLGVIERGDYALEEITRLAPDIAILDMMMPGKSGLTILENLNARESRCRVLIISGQANGLDFKRAIDLGAEGVMSKTEPPELIFDALDVISQGGRFISNAVRACVEPVEDARQINLTARERQVLALIAEGFSNFEIAKQIGIEVRTAKKHRENLMRKLKVSSAVDASRMAYQLGLASVTPESSVTPKL